MMLYSMIAMYIVDDVDDEYDLIEVLMMCDTYVYVCLADVRHVYGMHTGVVADSYII